MSLIKIAAPWGAFLSASKKMLGNKVIRNAAIGGTAGAIGGAINSEDGHRLSGSFKGGLLGAAIGGGSTAGFNISKNIKNGMTVSDSFRAEGSALNKTINLTKARFNRASDVLGRKAMPVGSPNRIMNIGGSSNFGKGIKPQAMSASMPIVEPLPKVKPIGHGPAASTQDLQAQSALKAKLSMQQKLTPEQLKDPALLSIPPQLRKDLTYAQVEKLNINPENLFTQGHDINNLRNLANNTNPSSFHNFNSLNTSVTTIPKRSLMTKRRSFSNLFGLIG